MTSPASPISRHLPGHSERRWQRFQPPAPGSWACRREMRARAPYPRMKAVREARLRSRWGCSVTSRFLFYAQWLCPIGGCRPSLRVRRVHYSAFNRLPSASLARKRWGRGFRIKIVAGKGHSPATAVKALRRAWSLSILICWPPALVWVGPGCFWEGRFNRSQDKDALQI